MKKFAFLPASLLMLGTVIGAAHATPSAGRAVNRDFAKLSIDGSRAFDDIAMARSALANNDIAGAQKLLVDANNALTRAKSDNRVFMKAEAQLVPAKKAPKGAPAPSAAPGTQPVAWLPVDGEYIVTEDLEPTSPKGAAVTSANTSLNKGKPGQAAQTLQVAGVDVDFVLAIAPLDASASDVYRATNLLTGKDVKNADNALQDAQNSIRFVSEDMVDTPAGQGAGKKAAH
ncbi:YfdX family protein [Komagataeibacter saccharivorans]|uniref:YfdX family protein n=1 Tax=Komagataeibacter saccharivorans TaxID=265959 RepID=UPI0039EB72CC